MSDSLDVTVFGTPAPQGSKRHVGGGRMIESSAKVTPWREAVKAAVLAQGQPVPMLGPLSVILSFTVARPSSAPKSRRWPDKRPDLDKLIRSTFDALGDVGVFADDAQIVHVTASKVFPDCGSLHLPGVRICVDQL